MTLEDLHRRLGLMIEKGTAPPNSMVFVVGADGKRYAVKEPTTDSRNAIIRLADEPLD